MSPSISSSSVGMGLAFFLDLGGLGAEGAGVDERCSPSSSSGGIDSSSGSSWATDRETCVSALLTGDGLFVLVVRLGDDGPASSGFMIAPGRRLTRRDLLLSPPSSFSFSTAPAETGDLTAAFFGDLAFAVAEADAFVCKECRFIASSTVDELTSSMICSVVVVAGRREDAIESDRGCMICLVMISKQSVRISLIISPPQKRHSRHVIQPVPSR